VEGWGGKGRLKGGKERGAGRGGEVVPPFLGESYAPGEDF